MVICSDDYPKVLFIQQSPGDVCSQNGHLTSTLATVFHIQNRTFHTAINILNTRPKKTSIDVFSYYWYRGRDLNP
ncbi:hypothetical protein [Candidatus Symbiopectobacterium sp.]|uniref:hypothetical protein n=1 Tax=Candidatus Symbiopectobacterium sp. TaxID=2816440 RepID=UPI0025B89F61|nr:hypothetical protein [Candidatus Symbiopectobacterium sp.]